MAFVVLFCFLFYSVDFWVGWRRIAMDTPTQADAPQPECDWARRRSVTLDASTSIWVHSVFNILIIATLHDCLHRWKFEEVGFYWHNCVTGCQTSASWVDFGAVTKEAKWFVTLLSVRGKFIRNVKHIRIFQGSCRGENQLWRELSSFGIWTWWWWCQAWLASLVTTDTPAQERSPVEAR